MAERDLETIGKNKVKFTVLWNVLINIYNQSEVRGSIRIQYQYAVRVEIIFTLVTKYPNHEKKHKH